MRTFTRCIFCSNGGSGDFATSHLLSITEQIETAKLKVAKKAKEYGLDEIYTILNQMCLDEAKHGKVFSSLLNEHFVYK